MSDAWRQSIKREITSNALRQKRAWQKMSEAQKLTGRTAEELDWIQLELRQNALRRFGRAA